MFTDRNIFISLISMNPYNKTLKTKNVTKIKNPFK